MSARKPTVCLISGSDSDLGGMVPVGRALREEGARTWWIGAGPADRTPPPSPRVMLPATCPPRGDVEATAVFIAEVQRQAIEALIDRGCDFVVLLGDRNEILAAAAAACLLRIPLGQVHAGELALGQTDNRVRHAVSRLSDLMFAPDALSCRRLRAWGEQAGRVFHVGSPFVDSLCPIKPLKGHRGLRPLEYVMCIYHPVRADDGSEYGQAGRVLARAEAARRRLSGRIGREAKLLLIEPSPDPGRWGIIRRWREAERERPEIVIYQERLPRSRYLQLLTHCAELIANSSGLFTEAAPLGVPMTLVGRRQKGRRLTRPRAARRPVLTRPLSGGPYGGPGASRRIARIVMSRLRKGGWKPKEFRDII